MGCASRGICGVGRREKTSALLSIEVKLSLSLLPCSFQFKGKDSLAIKVPLHLGPLQVLEGSLLLLRAKLEFPGLPWEFRAGLWKIARIILGRDGDYNKCTTSIIWLLF